MFSFPIERRPAFLGVIHLGPLPGAPRFAGDLDSIVRAAATDARALCDGGVDAVIVENFYDAPFHKSGLEPEAIAALTRCALAVRDVVGDRPIGINALRNDGIAALGVAVAVGARFIRINVLSGATVTDQGLIEGCAAALLRRRAALRCDVSILADVHVKHGAPLAAQPLDQAVRDLVHRAGADAVVVSGPGTGAATDPAEVAAVRAAADGTPVLIGSGTTEANAGRYLADGYIVGTALKNRLGRIEAERVAQMRRALDATHDSTGPTI